MKAYWSSASSVSRYSFLTTFALLLSIGIATGCGSGTPAPPKFSGNTSVTLLLASTANDQVSSFAVEFTTLTLTSQSGNTVALLSSQQPAEFMHLNGGIEPLTTATIPQDIYTTATVALGQAVFVCIEELPASLNFDSYSIINQAPTVNVPAPITITGSNMTLLLNLEVSSSAIFGACATTPPFQGFSLTPTFSLAPFALSASPTNSANGKVSGLKARVASVAAAGSSVTLTVAGGPFGTRTLSASSNSATVFQGISGASGISPGMFLDLDGAIQSDGSLLASRIAAEDSSAINESIGPITFVDPLAPLVNLYGRTELGALVPTPGQGGGYFELPVFDFSSASFNISGQLTNVQNLPFVPSFTASNMVAGQNVEIASQNFSLTGGTNTLANTITLIPQTINGTIVASQQAGNFTDNTVSLASYDLFPNLALQPGQTTLLNNPSQVEVYIDSGTQQLNTQALVPGNTLRFYGLVFNDNGTLRMDCAQVSDGLAATPEASSAVTVHGVTRTVRRDTGGRVLQAVTTGN